MPAHRHDHNPLQIFKRLAAMLLLTAASATSLPAQPTESAAAPRVTIRYEVATSAIATALAAEGLAIPSDHLHLSVPLSATNAAPQLRIAAAEIRQDATLELRLLCRNSGECMPFFATVAMPDRESALAALAGLHGASAPPKPDQPTAPHAVERAPARAAAIAPVISPGTRVTLELNDTQMHIQLPAVAIDTGAPGAEVRVASLDRKHTWRATVIDAATVRGGLQ